MFYYNTNSILDIATGIYSKGLNNKLFLNGGIAPTFAIVGKSQTYKSGLTLSYLSRALRIYKDSQAFVYDTEFAIAGKDRILDLGSELDNYLDTDRDELKDR